MMKTIEIYWLINIQDSLEFMGDFFFSLLLAVLEIYALIGSFQDFQ